MTLINDITVSDLKPYSEYKDPAIPWIGKLPNHWKLQRAKWLFQKMDRPVCDSDEVVTCFRDGTVTLRKNRRVRGFTESLKEIGYQGIRRGDLVIHAMDAFAGAVGVSDSDGKGTPVYSVCAPLSNVNPYYYAYIIREMARSQWILALAKGIRERSTDFRFEGFASQFVPLPPLDEQNTIVRYLDHMDRLIKRYIRAKQKEIKLLNEQKQAIIHKAITRGLNPDVKLKPSGVEWLGDIPEHWKVTRSKYIFREIDKRSITGEETHLSMSQKLGLIPSSEIEEKRLLSDSYIGGKLCQQNDLILNRLKAHLGVFALASQPGLVSPDYTVLRSIRQNNPQYFEFVLRTPSCRVEFQKRTKGIVQGFWRLYTDDFYDIRLPIPPLNEQKSIVDHLASLIVEFDYFIRNIKNDIALITEYRTRLISEVVTGKLDVRKAAAYLPEELAGPEPEEELPEEEALEEELETEPEEGGA